MSWDLNRLAWEVGERLRAGQTLEKIRDWLDPTGKVPVGRRQPIDPVPHGPRRVRQRRFLGVIIERILWQVDGITNKPVGFVLQGLVYRDRKSGLALDPCSIPWLGGSPKVKAYAFSSSSYSSITSSSSSSSKSSNSSGPGFR